MNNSQLKVYNAILSYANAMLAFVLSRVMKEKSDCLFALNEANEVVALSEAHNSRKPFYWWFLEYEKKNRLHMAFLAEQLGFVVAKWHDKKGPHSALPLLQMLLPKKSSHEIARFVSVTYHQSTLITFAALLKASIEDEPLKTVHAFEEMMEGIKERLQQEDAKVSDWADAMEKGKAL